MDENSQASAMAGFAEALAGDRSEAPTVEAIIAQAAVVVPGAQHVSLTIGATKTGYHTLGASSALADEADALQYSLHEGPCLDAARDGAWVRSGDVATDERWPTWGPAVAKVGMRSVLSVHLVSQRASFGAINLYSEQVGAFVEPEEVDRGLLWATHAALALGSARIISGLETAMVSRHMIGMAQGKLMARYGLDQDQSFKLLIRLSSHRNQKLREVAEQVVAGELDPA